MRKIIAGLFISLDGVVESPDRWVFPYVNDEVGAAVGASINESDTLSLGHKTYDKWAAYWPGKTAEDEPFAGYMNNVARVVVSKTLESPSWEGATVVRGSRAELAALKERPGKNIAISGSATLIRSLLQDCLLDELRLLVFPVVVGSGAHLFDEVAQQIPLQLVASSTTATGVLSLTYSRSEA